MVKKTTDGGEMAAPTPSLKLSKTNYRAYSMSNNSFMSLVRIKDYTYTIIYDGKVPQKSFCILHIS